MSFLGVATAATEFPEELPLVSSVATIRIVERTTDQWKSSSTLADSIATKVRGIVGINAVTSGPIVVRRAYLEDRQENLPTDCEEFADDDEGVIQWLENPNGVRLRLNENKEVDLHNRAVDCEHDMHDEMSTSHFVTNSDNVACLMSIRDELRAALLHVQAWKQRVSVDSDRHILDRPAQEGEQCVLQQHASAGLNPEKLHVSQPSLDTACSHSESTSPSDTDCMSSASEWKNDASIDPKISIGEEVHVGAKHLTEPMLVLTGLVHKRVSAVPYLATVSRFRLRKSWSEPDLTVDVGGSGAGTAVVSTTTSRAQAWASKSHIEQVYPTCALGFSTRKLMKCSSGLGKSMCTHKLRVRALEDDFKNMLARIKSEGLVLSRQVEELAVDAFDYACQRTVPGAMEIFEDTGAELTRISSLLQKCALAGTG